MEPGDAVLGIASGGLHSNGYSLARKVLFEIGGYDLGSSPEGLGRTLGEELLSPTVIYVKTALGLRRDFDVRAFAHVTGGGLPGNVPRVVPDGLFADIDGSGWPRPPVFDLIRKTGNVDPAEMYRTFNCGIGMVAVVPAEQAEEAASFAGGLGREAFVIGEIREAGEGEGKIGIS